MDWPAVFIVLLLSHLVGDFLLQTDWQAENKHGGLSGGESGRALLSHLLTYSLAFVPALVWIGGGEAALAAGLIVVPHLVQDDGRLLSAYMQRIKGPGAEQVPLVAVAADQTFHLLVLFATALAVTA